jgi:hypothetical protein
MTKPDPRSPERARQAGRPNAAARPEGTARLTKVQIELPDGRYLIAFGRQPAGDA